MTLKIGHIVNPVKVNPGNKSYLDIAQPVTYQSMLNAKEVVEKDSNIKIILCAVGFQEDMNVVPNGFIQSEPMKKSTLDILPKNMVNKRKLPLIYEILKKGYDLCDVDYLIYTNCDIGITKDFYKRIATLIDEGYDGLCIHRQDYPKKIGPHVLSVNTMNLIYGINNGKIHPGHDCMVFKKSMFHKLTLGNVFIGYPPVGSVLCTQIKRNSKKYKELTSHCKMTFHLGSDVSWAKKVNNNGQYKHINFGYAAGKFDLR